MGQLIDCIQQPHRRSQSVNEEHSYEFYDFIFGCDLLSRTPVVHSCSVLCSKITSFSQCIVALEKRNANRKQV
jgi:hypothetical protein